MQTGTTGCPGDPTSAAGQTQVTPSFDEVSLPLSSQSYSANVGCEEHDMNVHSITFDTCKYALILLTDGSSGSELLHAYALSLPQGYVTCPNTVFKRILSFLLHMPDEHVYVLHEFL